MSTEQLLTTPLHALHRELGARMVPFAGYDMPVDTVVASGYLSVGKPFPVIVRHAVLEKLRGP